MKGEAKTNFSLVLHMIYDMIFHNIADNATPRQKVHILTSKKREKGRFV